MTLTTKQPIVIAIIDSGIDPTKLGNKVKIEHTGYSVNEAGFLVENRDKPVEHLHGTAIVQIITEICEHIEIISVNILNKSLSTDGRILMYAIDETIERKPDIIHLSLGTKKFRYYFKLKKIIKKAQSQNIKVVAAVNNLGHYSFPVVFKDVIGVKAAQYENKNDLGYDGHYFLAPCDLNPLSGADHLKKEYFACGSSFAAAYVTGHVSKRLLQKRNLSASELKTILIKESRSANEK